MSKGLGRLYIPDERDAAYPMRAAIPREAPERTHRYWWTTKAWHGDQGSFPHCVGYSLVHLLSVGPIVHKGRPPVDPRYVYHEAQKIDAWPGENYAGTSVRAGAKILQNLGLIESYLWAYDVDTMLDALFNVGPVVLGTTWYSGMSNPDKEGIIRARGTVQGGHAYTAVGGNRKTGFAKIMQSWGKDHGRNGFVYLPLEDLPGLIADHGEICLPILTKPKRIAA